MKEEKQGINLKEFAETYECNYEAASRKLKKLIRENSDMKNHVSTRGRQYTLDEYAIRALIPKKYVTRKKRETGEIERLKKEHEQLVERQKEISNELRQREQEILFKRYEQIGGVVYRCLGRTYLDGDENRLDDFLSKCADFKSCMNKKSEDAQEDVL